VEILRKFIQQFSPPGWDISPATDLDQGSGRLRSCDSVLQLSGR
jgi:hypothetical protein